MKRLLKPFFLLFVAATTLSALLSCLSDNEPDDRLIIDPADVVFDSDAAGRPVWPDLKPMSRASFDQLVVGHAWHCDATFEIMDNGIASHKNLWGSMLGMGPTHYFFDKDSVTMFVYNDAHGNINAGLGYMRLPYSFDERDNGIYIDGRRELQLAPLKLSSTQQLSAIQHIAQRSDGRHIYGMSVFRRLNDREYQQLRETYKVRWE
ncbi:MAG: hypothetical protein I3J02_00020 [Prevotella sp.]|nr:hypothetical protein [Prevotella sp.]